MLSRRYVFHFRRMLTLRHIQSRHGMQEGHHIGVAQVIEPWLLRQGTGMDGLLVAVPNANQRQSQPIFCAILMTMTTTSVSTVLRSILFFPCSVPYVACTVAASSYVQLISPARSQGADDNTSTSRVTITSPGNSSSDH